MYKDEIEKLEKQILNIENLIDKDEEYIYEDEFEMLNETMLNKWNELNATLEQPLEDKMCDELVEKINKNVKKLKSFKNRIKNIQETVGRAWEDDDNSMMFPNVD
jgi:hypothetical protein